jgi:hypothetical protein
VHRLRVASPLRLLVGPVVLVLVFAVLRDVPPAADCGDGGASAAVLSDYRAAALPMVLAAAALTLAVWLGALRLSRGARHAGLSIPFVAAVAGLVVAWPLLAHEPDNRVVEAFVAGIAAAALTLAAGRAAIGRGWSWSSLGAVLMVAALLALPSLAVVFLAVFFPGVAAAVVAAIATFGLWRAVASQSAPAFANVAAFVAVVVLPLAYLVILTRGDQPVLC